MTTLWHLLPQSGGFLVYVDVPGRERVSFSVDLPKRLQDDRLPRLRSGCVRLRFPSEIFSREAVDCCLARLQDRVESINAHRYRKWLQRSSQAPPTESEITEPTAYNDVETEPVGRASRPPEYATVRGPESVRLDPASLFPEWVVFLDKFRLGLGRSSAVTEEIASLLAPVIIEALTRSEVIARAKSESPPPTSPEVANLTQRTLFGPS